MWAKKKMFFIVGFLLNQLLIGQELPASTNSYRSRLVRTKESLKKSALVAAEGIKGAAYLAKEKIESCPVVSSALQQTKALRDVTGKVTGLAAKLGLSAAYGVSLYNSLTVIKHELENTKKAINYFVETAQDAKEVAAFLRQFQIKGK